MNTRLAQIIAQSLGADGKPDPMKVYDALRIAPDDPIALIIDGVLAAREVQSENLSAIQDVLNSERVRFAELLAAHTDRADSSARALMAQITTFANDRNRFTQAIESHAEKIRADAFTLAEQARRVGTSVEVFSNRALVSVFCLGLVVGGIASWTVIHFFPQFSF
jgi:hypothetical protein